MYIYIYIYIYQCICELAADARRASGAAALAHMIMFTAIVHTRHISTHTVGFRHFIVFFWAETLAH